MTIEFEDFRVFLAAAEHGSFGRAASSLGLAQPSVSNRMAALEQRLGRPLFSRSTRGATLTPAGERLVPHARRALQVVEDAQASARAPHYRPPIRVLLAASYTPVLLPAVIEVFDGDERPLSVSYDHGHNIVRAIATGEADIGFLAPCPHPTTVELRSLGSSPIVAVAAPDHPLVGRRRLTFAGLGDYRIAFSSWGDGADVFLELLPGDVHVCTIFPVSAAAQLARHDGYVALAPQAALAADLRSGALRQLSVSDMPTDNVALALAFHRRGTVPVGNLITRARQALQAPDVSPKPKPRVGAKGGSRSAPGLRGMAFP